MPQSLQHPDPAGDTDHSRTRRHPHRQVDHRRGGITGVDTAITPALARQLVARYTGRGDTVCDPDPGPGLVLAEALRAGRHAVGLRPPPPWEPILGDTLDLARLARAGAGARVTVLEGVEDPRAAALPAPVDLVLTGLRHTPAEHPSERVVDLYERLTAVIEWVWPGGHVVITCRPWCRRGRLLDLAAMIQEAAAVAGLDSVEDGLVLSSPGRGHQACPCPGSPARPGPAATGLGRRSPTRPADIDVFVFRVPTTQPSCQDTVWKMRDGAAAA